MLNHLYEGKFCCASMESAQRDSRWLLDYDPEDKSHFMIQNWPHTSNIFVFFYCPWCAKDIRPDEFKE